MRSLVLAALALCPSLPSLAEAPASTSAAPAAPDPLQRLKALNERVKQGVSGLAGPYGHDDAAEAARIDKAAAALAEARAALAKEAKAPAAARAVVEENVALLERELERSRLAHAYTKAFLAVLAKHKSGAPATDAELLALEQAAAALRDKGGPGWQATATHFSERVERLRQDRAALASVAEQQQAEAEKQKRELELLEAFRAANRARRKLEVHLEDTRDPIPQALLDEYMKAAQNVARLSEAAGRYYTMSQRDFQVTSAWRDPAFEAGAGRIANLLQGALVDAGVARGKTLKINIPAQAGWCYATVLRFAEDTGAEEVTDLQVTSRGKQPLVRFQVPYTGIGWQGTQGACSEDGGRITVSAKISREGKNDLRYLIVGWPREDFPSYVATYMDVVVDDLCDTDAWYATWTRAVPGALVYRGEEPFLIARAERPPLGTVTLLSASGDRIAGVPKAELTSTPPATRAFTTKFEWKGCPVAEAARHPDSKKLAKCHAAIDRQYEKAIARATRRLDAASTDAARERADKELARLREKETADRQKKCEPMERRLRDKWQRTFDRVLDYYAESAVGSTLDRAGQLKAEQEARPDLR